MIRQNKEYSKSDFPNEFAGDFLDLEEYVDTNMPDPAMVEYYRRLRVREYLVNSEIEDSLIELSMYIQKWNKEDKELEVEQRKPIKIFINTDGGYTDVVLHIIDIIRLSKTPVYTIGLGRVYSAGGLLLMAGHKRYIFPNTRCLIHDGSSGALGSVGKMLDNLEFTKELEKRIREYILTTTKITKEMYDKNYRRDWFLFADEMIRLGVADEVISDLDIIL